MRFKKNIMQKCNQNTLFDTVKIPVNTNSIKIDENNKQNNGMTNLTLKINVNGNGNSENIIKKPARQRFVHFVEELRRRSATSIRVSIDKTRVIKKNSSQTSSESYYSSSNEGEFSLEAQNTLTNFNNNIYCTTSLPCSLHCMSSNFDAYRGGKGERGCSVSIGTQSSLNFNQSILIKHGQYHRSALLSSCSLDTSKITQESISNRFRCLCESCPVVIGTKLFLVLYICLTVTGILFGMVSTMVWTLIPIFVIPMAFRAFWTRNPKYLYPFLIVTIIQMIVCLLMAFIVTAFAIFNFEKLSFIITQILNNNIYNNNNIKRHSAYIQTTKLMASDTSLPFRHFDYTTVSVLLITATILACFLLSILFGWQILVISSCIDYYDLWSTHQNDEHNSIYSKMSNYLLPSQSGLQSCVKIQKAALPASVLSTPTKKLIIQNK